MRDDVKKVVKAGVDKAAEELTSRLQRLGFKRTKKWYWVRLKSDSADFVHLHRSGSSYGGPINYSVTFSIHCGNRVLSESLDFLHLNGPGSDAPQARENKYHLRFNAKSGSTYARCLDDLERFVIEIGEPWFSSIESSKNNSDNPSPESIMQTCKLLGIKGVKCGSS